MGPNVARDQQRFRRGQVGVASSLAVVFTLLVAGCGGSNNSTSSTTTTTTTTAAPQGGGGNSPSGGGSQSGGGGPTGPTPTIVSFTTPDNIDCHNGNFQNFTASWRTSGAVRVSITSGGSNLPANGSTSLPFNCSSAHTFTLTAYGSGGRTATRSVTLQPRNVQPPSTDSTGTT